MSLAPARRPLGRGHADPRVAPPLPAQSWARELTVTAEAAGISLFPWQKVAAKYLMARGPETWLFREVCIVVARQNGKTTLLLPRIKWGLEHGRRIVHTAQNRWMPREIFMQVAQVMETAHLARSIRYANGQEAIQMKNGGSYRIVAPQRGVRGLSADDLIVDELREFTDYDFISAATPILTASADPQVIYLSNAGADDSIVLNDLRDSTSDALAYLEWSADPDLDAADPLAWEQANPALRHIPQMATMLGHQFESKPDEVFETEHLCRWVRSMTPPLVSDDAWAACQANALEQPIRPALGIAVDPAGRRASAVLAWAQTDGTYALRPLVDVESDLALDVDVLGADLRRQAARHRARQVGFSGVSDVALSRHLPAAKPIDGRLYANASANFTALVNAGAVRWLDGDVVTEDLHHTVRRTQPDGAAAAVPSGDRPVTAVLAAIRALWLASAPRQVPRIG